MIRWIALMVIVLTLFGISVLPAVAADGCTLIDAGHGTRTDDQGLGLCDLGQRLAPSR